MKKIIIQLFAIARLFSNMTFADNMTENEKTAIESYIFGYPLVTMDMTEKVMTNVKKADGLKAPIGQFMNARTYPDASFRDVTAPNADTLYSVAWLDLSFEPYVLHLPDVGDRYYLMPLLSGWTEVFESLGTRTTGTRAQDFVIAGPDWKGNSPSNLRLIRAPTNMVWILGRTYCTGTLEDYKIVHEIQDRYSLTPLSHFGKPMPQIEGTVNSTIDMKTPVRDQVNALNATSYFNKLTMLMENNPPSSADSPLILKMSKIGIVPGKEFQLTGMDPELVNFFENVPKLAVSKIMAHEPGTLVNGWLMSLNTGTYGVDYLQRALIAAIGLGANLPQDAIYPMAKTDKEGKTLNGKNKYVIHFTKGQTPPVKGFWSLTMYNKEFFFVENPLNRFTVSPRNDLKYNEDGSLDLYIQNENPGKDKENNWLPAPTDDFILMFRFYWPENSILKGTWKPPFIVNQKTL